MRITNIAIEDFKGLEELEFEPSGINIITGRNNTSKTTLLESIDIAFNPENVKKFEGNINRLINIRSDAARITCEYSRPRQAGLADFTENAGELNEERNVRIKRAETSGTLDIFSDAIMKAVQAGRGARFFLSVLLFNPRMSQNFRTGWRATMLKPISKTLFVLPLLICQRNGFWKN